MTEPFHFKQFSIQQERCAMKVGTDGVLLGSWASLDHFPETALDIGSGTGLIALMLAQRSPHTFIEAIEIDGDAYEQCTENFETSPWADRLYCYHASLLEFVEEVEDTFSSIICNPPFYNSSYKTKQDSRNLARFQDAMPFEHIIYAVAHLLAKDGKFAIIINFEEATAFIELAQSAAHLHLNRICNIKGHAKADFKRSLLEFSYQASEVQEDELTIEIDRHIYTQDYKNLTQDFYMKM